MVDRKLILDGSVLFLFDPSPLMLLGWQDRPGCGLEGWVGWLGSLGLLGLLGCLRELGPAALVGEAYENMWEFI